MRTIAIFAISIYICAPLYAFAQGELHAEQVELVRARVLHATTPVAEELLGISKHTSVQEITVRIEEGHAAGREVTFKNDYIMLVDGEVCYVKHVWSQNDEGEFFFVVDPYRLPTLLTLFLLFVGVCVLVGGWQGTRGMLSLGVGIAAIYAILLPLILAGYNPVLSSIVVVSIIVVLGSYVTHGVSWTTTSAVIGMVLTIVFSGILAEYAIQYARLTGYGAEESVYLSMNTGGELSLVSLLLGGILIGLLGVLYDSAIGQAIAVEELYRAVPQRDDATVRHIFTRAMRIGREHIGALVNTLAIAYVGAALPLLLLVEQSSSAPLLVTLNSEVFATEIIRILVGSVGVIVTVPVTTLCAVWLLRSVSLADTQRHSHAHRH